MLLQLGTFNWGLHLCTMMQRKEAWGSAYRVDGNLMSKSANYWAGSWRLQRASDCCPIYGDL